VTEQGGGPRARRPASRPRGATQRQPTERTASGAKGTARSASRPVPTPAMSDSGARAVQPEPIQLYLLRHADAGDPMSWTGDDADRPLSTKGRRQARRLGNMLGHVGWKPDLMLTSPKVRAADTARIVGRAVDAAPEEERALASGFGLADLGKVLAAHPAAKRVVLVGHDPDFSELASTLTGATIELRKGAIARIDLHDAAPGAGKGALRWLIPPGVVPD